MSSLVVDRFSSETDALGGRASLVGTFLSLVVDPLVAFFSPVDPRERGVFSLDRSWGYLSLEVDPLGKRVFFSLVDALGRGPLASFEEYRPLRRESSFCSCILLK